MPRKGGRRGIALLVALMVLGVAGTLLVAGYYAARADADARFVSERAAQLSTEAEGALVDAMMVWDSAGAFRQPVGSTRPAPGEPSGDGASASVWVTRVSPITFWLAARLADRRDSSVATRAAVLVRVRVPVLVLRADSSVSLDTVRGPSWQDLASWADVVLPAGWVGPVPSGNLVSAAGGVEFTGGSGTGVILVDGPVEISGPVNFRGVILSTGRVQVSGAGVSVAGVLSGAQGLSVKSLGSLMLRQDTAVVSAVVWHAGRQLFVSSRAWMPSR